jgi:phosphoglycolate phosphatase
MNRINSIIWDWNGTLLNDVDICIESINILLKKRNLPVLSKRRYRHIFTFPVKNYYIESGFDFTLESWERVATDFMDLYFSKLPVTGIFPEAPNVLRILKQEGYKQILVSAMEHESLVRSVRDKGLYPYFDSVGGIENHFADGKMENAKNSMRNLELVSASTVLIGDTTHDFEVAGELGIKCILVSRGHQSASRLKKLNCAVLSSLNEIPVFLDNIQSR